jgi:hypothetical protein
VGAVIFFGTGNGVDVKVSGLCVSFAGLTTGTPSDSVNMARKAII